MTQLKTRRLRAKRMRISVIIPTYRRPSVLRKAVASLFEGTTRHPDEVVIVGRKSDYETVQTIAEMQQHSSFGTYIQSAWVTIPGHLPPVETGIKTASGDLAAIIDDDVTVTAGWLERISTHFIDPKVGLVGGRVIVPGMPQPKVKGYPGQVSWYGRYWGNVGSVDGDDPFEVVSVMEGNSIWRRQLAAALVYETVLNFDDASMYGLDMSFQAKANGFRVLYDPQAVVYHHVSPRNPELARTQRSRRTMSFTRNSTYIMLKHLPWWQKITFLVWWFLIGGRSDWGVCAVIYDLVHNRGQSRREFAPALAGKVEGIRLWLIRQKYSAG
jgi:glycosyltransferase involved in cell wall biosynthesis